MKQILYISPSYFLEIKPKFWLYQIPLTIRHLVYSKLKLLTWAPKCSLINTVRFVGFLMSILDEETIKNHRKLKYFKQSPRERTEGIRYTWIWILTPWIIGLTAPLQKLRISEKHYKIHGSRSLSANHHSFRNHFISLQLNYNLMTRNRQEECNYLRGGKAFFLQSRKTFTVRIIGFFEDLGHSEFFENYNI